MSSKAMQCLPVRINVAMNQINALAEAHLSQGIANSQAAPTITWAKIYVAPQTFKVQGSLQGIKFISGYCYIQTGFLFSGVLNGFCDAVLKTYLKKMWEILFLILPYIFFLDSGNVS